MGLTKKQTGALLGLYRVCRKNRTAWAAQNAEKDCLKAGQMLTEAIKIQAEIEKALDAAEAALGSHY